MTVLIAGAGICGLTLGLSLNQIGVPFRIFEAVETLAPLGVGINVQPHAVRELFDLGLEKELDEIGLRTEELAYFSRQGRLIWSEPRGMKAGYRWPQFSIHRGRLQMALHDALVARCGADAVVTGAALSGWRQRADGVVIDLKDRRSGAQHGSETGSLLIAADGINSTARALFYPDEGPASWGGTMMWRGVTRGPRFLTGRSVTMTGTRACKFACYPIADIGEDGSLINWICDLAYPPDYEWRKQDWNRAGDRDDFLGHFEDWHFDWLDVPAVIRGAETIYEYPMVDREPVPRWVDGRVALIGDAAHAMYPIGSNGASQAILDARHLAAAIKALGPVPDALSAYETERLDKVNALVLANRADGPDRVLEIVAERAPDGFADIQDVMSHAELETMAGDYKALAGMDIDALNNRPPILQGAAGR